MTGSPLTVDKQSHDPSEVFCLVVRALVPGLYPSSLPLSEHSRFQPEAALPLTESICPQKKAHPFGNSVPRLPFGIAIAVMP
jgi:hypothetical protein